MAVDIEVFVFHGSESLGMLFLCGTILIFSTRYKFCHSKFFVGPVKAFGVLRVRVSIRVSRCMNEIVDYY